MNHSNLGGCHCQGCVWKQLQSLAVKPVALGAAFSNSAGTWEKVTAPLGCQGLEKGEDAPLDKDVGSVLSDLD